MYREVQVSAQGASVKGGVDRLNRGMQDCFRQHPEMYGSELEDDEEEVEDELRARESAPAPKDTPEYAEPSAKLQTEAILQPSDSKIDQTKPIEEEHRDSRSTTAEKAQKLGDEGGELLPKAVHDATSK
jgi:intermembrane space import and assembly protein 40